MTFLFMKIKMKQQNTFLCRKFTYTNFHLRMPFLFKRDPDHI